MKKYRKVRLLALLMTVVLMTGCSAGSLNALEDILLPVVETAQAFEASQLDHQAPQGMVGVVQQGDLSLFVDEATACVAVYDASSGQWFYSNPVDASQDPKASKTEKNVLMSQLAVSYYKEDLSTATFYSAADAVNKEQYTIERLPQGLRVTYQMGSTQPITDLMPRYITPERMQTMVYDHLPEDAVAYIQKRYINSTTKAGCLELPPATRKSTLVAKKLAEYFVQAGYTWEDQAEDNQMCGYEAVDSSCYITVPLEYRLLEDHLAVQVLVHEIECVGGLSLCGLSVLPFFGAGSTEDTGYMLVPGGSGALIRFNNGKQKEAVYQQPIYGTDPATSALGRLQNSQDVRIPVFGAKRNESAFLAVVAQGEAEGFINADVSGRKNSYNNVYASFVLRDSDNLSMSSSTGNEASMRLVEKNIYEGPVGVDYYFLAAGAGYSEMANRYQTLLQASGVLSPLTEETNSPFYLSVIGAIDKTERLLGVPYQATVTLTTAEQAATMAEELAARGDASVRLRLMGWFNGGVDHASASHVSMNRQVGNAEAITTLAEQLDAQGGKLYLDVAFQYVPEGSGHFNRAQEAIRTISGEVKNEAVYLLGGSPSTRQNMGSLFYVTTPTALEGRMESFLRGMDALPEMNYALRDLAAVLPSDPYIQRGYSRTLTQRTVEKTMEAFQGRVGQVMAVAPNAYAWGAADELIDVPEEGVGFYLVDESVPFCAMVLHGMKDYAGTPLNTRADFNAEADILTMLENGSAPHFMLSWEESYRMNGSVYEQWYSVSKDVWMDECVRFMQIYEDVLLPLRLCTITQHEILANGVRVVTYSDGTRVCVNPQAIEAAYEGHVLAPMAYLVLKGEDGP